MSKPPPETPHSDMGGVNRDGRAGQPNRAAALGSSAAVADAEANAKARPERSGQRR